MKSGVAAFVAAAAELVASNPPPGSIALLVTGDEEGEALHGTRAILDWMAEHGEEIDFCIVGEPTSLARVGDQIKIGRRGSMTGTMTVTGRAGHTAYPDAALNPLPALARLCDRLSSTPLDMGSTHFEASTLALSTIDVGNTASNVIPRQGRAVFNIRFNDRHSSDELKVWAEEIVVAELAESGLGEAGLEVELSWQVSGESFYTPPGGVADVVSDAIRERMLEMPALSTGGGTSDARFIKDHCPVVELGLVGDTMHQADERVPVEDIRTLSVLYGDILRRFFGV
jgi:succinyl-diaminopimelate desuccinylase